MASTNTHPPATVPYPRGDSDGADATNIGTQEVTETPQQQQEGPRANDGFIAKVSLCMATIIPPGGIAASAFNIGSTTVGAGIFGLPAAANSSGLVMAMLYNLLITGMTIFSIYALGVAAERTNIRTYEGVARALLGPCGAYYSAATRAFFSFGACVAYVISVGDILSAILKGTDAPDFLKQKSGNRLLTTVMWLCFMLPLVIPRHVDSLRHVSTVAFILMIYMVIVVVVHSCMNGLPENIKSVSVGPDDNAEIILFNSGNKAIEGLGVFIFSYLFHITAYEVYMDMTDRSVRKFVLVVIIAMGMCLPMYALTAFFGYLDFGREVTGSVLLQYDPVKFPAIMIGFIGVLVMLFVSYALLGIACRNALYDVIGWDFNTVAFWKHCVAVVSLSIVMLICGLFIPKINTVLGLAGSFCGGSLGFVLPALFFMYCGGFTWQKVGPFYYIATYVLLITGVIAIVFGTGATIWSVTV